MLNDSSVNDFKASLRGELIRDGEPGYEEARKIHNAMISKRPMMIARCADVADVIACVNFARTTKVPVAIRSGGHNGGGLGICDKGLVIDLSRIKYVRVNPEEKTVVVGGGTTWGDVDHATHAFGMAVPSGIVSTTGVGGLTLGGGIGHLTRKFGLTIDSLLSVDMVLADGSFVTANARQNQDLFWAVRGGGGNFGVCTAFTYQLHPISTVFAGPMLWDLSDAEEIMKWYARMIKPAPDDLNGFFAFLTVPPGPPFPEHLHMKKMCGVVWTYTGKPEKADETFAAIRSFKKPALDLVGQLPLPALQGMFDALVPAGLQYYWRADFVNDLKDEAIKKHIKWAEQMPTMLSTMHMYPVNGAASRVRSGDTAWSYRDAMWAMIVLGADPDPANAEKITAWTKAYQEDLHPYSAGGAYVNFMMDEGIDRVRATYRDNFDRLVKVKDKYDPENLFCINQNIQPTVKKKESVHA
ncbi:MAG TPA: FAD-binding oxidoreductase [Bacteroidota bacterium]|nr:FAD-binding oxidoreductase [Bacteroidota bacterium]